MYLKILKPLIIFLIPSQGKKLINLKVNNYNINNK